MPDYGSAQGSSVAPPPWNRSTLESVEGHYAPPPPGRPQGVPTSFGSGKTDMATAFEGALSDMRAVSQETLKVLSEVGIMAQRISAQLGGVPGSEGTASPIPNSVASMFPSAGAVGAAVTASLGLAYGSSMGGGVRPNPAYANLPNAMTNPAYQTFGGGTAAPVSVGQGPGGGPVPTGQPGWEPAKPEEKKETNSAIQMKSFFEGEAGEKFLTNTGPEDLAHGKNLAAHPSVNGIAQSLAQHVMGGRDWSTTAEKTLSQLSRGQQAKIISTGTATATYTPTEEAVSNLAALRAGAPVSVEASGLKAGVAAVAGGEGVEAGLGAAAGGLAGPIGLGIGAAVLGVHELDTQRAANAQIQSQIGGSNFSAFGTRAQGLGYGLTHLATMSMGESNQAFSGVTDLGLQGGKRSDALSFVQSNYSSLGMSVSDSMGLLSTAVKAGNANLQQLASTLDAVTNSAAAAGINTEQARQNFTQMYTSAINGGMMANSASTFAGASSMMSSHFGQMGTGLQFGQASPAQAAAAMGVPLSTYYANIGQGGYAGAQYGAQAQDQVVKGLLGGIGSGIPGIESMARQQFNKDQGSNGEFAQSMMRQGGMTPTVMMQMLQTAGIKGVTAQNVWEVAAGAMTGQENLTTAVTRTGAEQSINSQIAKLRPNAGGWFTNQVHSSTMNHQLSGAEQNIDQYIGKNGVKTAGSQAAAALLAHGTQDMVTGAGFGAGGTQGSGETIQAALGNKQTFDALMAGKGTIDANGKKMSISQFVAAHRTSLTPKSNTAKGGTGKGVGNITVGLSPQAAQLLSLTTSGAAVLGNNSSTLNSPPTMDPVSFTSGS